MARLHFVGFISTDFALARGTSEVGKNAGDGQRQSTGSVRQNLSRERYVCNYGLNPKLNIKLDSSSGSDFFIEMLFQNHELGELALLGLCSGNMLRHATCVPQLVFTLD